MVWCVWVPQSNEAIRYLEYCVQMLDVSDQAIHNYLLSLYAQMQPQNLMKYLEFQGQVGAQYLSTCCSWFCSMIHKHSWHVAVSCLHRTRTWCVTIWSMLYACVQSMDTRENVSTSTAPWASMRRQWTWPFRCAALMPFVISHPIWWHWCARNRPHLEMVQCRSLMTWGPQTTHSCV